MTPFLPKIVIDIPNLKTNKRIMSLFILATQDKKQKHMFLKSI